MDVHTAFGLFFILDLFSHGISAPILNNYYENTQNEDYQISDDITDSYERYPRNALPNPDFWHQYRWYTRSLIPSRPRQASKRHYHLFHLTSKHPNAVSYHVIEKPHAAAKTVNSRHKVESSPRRSYLYNNNGASQYQAYPAQSYYQQPNYQYPGYPGGYGSSYPQTQYGVQNGGGVHDSTYDDILDVVSKPMQIGNKIIPPYHDEDHLNDQTPPSIEEAAKEFKLASADMNNMELASLVIYPIPRFNDKAKVHKKKSKTKHTKHHDKKVKAEKSPKVENEGKTESNLVDNLIKNEKEGKSERHEDTKEKEKLKAHHDEDEEMKEDNVKNENKKEKENDAGNKQKDDKKDKDDDDEMDDDKDSSLKDSWAEEEISTKGGEGYTSSKRSEIPHVNDEISNSKEDDEYISSKRSEIPQSFDVISNSNDDDDAGKNEVNNEETAKTENHSEEDEKSYEGVENDQRSENSEGNGETEDDKIAGKTENDKDESDQTD